MRGVFIVARALLDIIDMVAYLSQLSGGGILLFKCEYGPCLFCLSSRLRSSLERPTWSAGPGLSENGRCQLMKLAPPSVGANHVLKFVKTWRTNFSTKMLRKVEEKLVFNGVVELFKQQFCWRTRKTTMSRGGHLALASEWEGCPIAALAGLPHRGLHSST